MLSSESSPTGGSDDDKNGDGGIVWKKSRRNGASNLTITTCIFIVAQMVAMLPNTATATDIEMTVGDDSNGTDADAGAFDKQILFDGFLTDLYKTISKNMAENSRKLNLEDFSWGIFSGSKGRLQGLDHFQLVNNETVTTASERKLNMSFEFTVPTLGAVWEKSVCLGYSCVMTIELHQAVFALRAVFDADQCVFEHLAYLKNYRNAGCFVSYLKTSSIPGSFVQTTVKLLSRVMNTQPFQKIIKDNVDYALLQLPLFSAADIRRICYAFRTFSS